VLKVSAGFQSRPLQKNLQGESNTSSLPMLILTGFATIKPSDGTVKLLQGGNTNYPNFYETVSEKQKVAP
jgi:hypothetical protein